MEFKKLIGAGLVIMGISVSFSIKAADFIASDLTIVNNTNQDSTSIINHGACSTILGSSGVTKAHSTNVVSASKVSLACFFNPSNCQADVYMTNNCTGAKVATVIFNANNANGGIKSLEIFDKRYTITGSGFKFTISGGPA